MKDVSKPPLRFYNTYTRQVELFQPLQPPTVRVYTCGPTVYGDQHIGNYRTFIFEDVLVKTLRLWGYDVRRVMNITDVGHLTSDADEGEDKLEVGARREGMTAWEVAQKYEAAFRQDLRELNIEEPTLVRATDTVKEQIDLICRLEEQGYTYRTEDGIYFDSSQVSDYGALARLDVAGLQAGKRVEMREGKRRPTDFALWKFSPPGHRRDMEWDSPWGKGFPGWHIECSAIALHCLGETLDIHCGGVDHIPVHHVNEIAQSEAATGRPLARFWMHGDVLLMERGKMAKSLGNLFTVADLRSRGYDPLDYRYFCFTASYRAKLNFTWEGLTAAQTALRRLRAALRRENHAEGREAGLTIPEKLAKLIVDNQPAASLWQNFLDFIADDLNVPAVIGKLNEYSKDPLPDLHAHITLVKAVDLILDLDLLRVETEALEGVPDQVQSLVHQREAARAKGEWASADQLRQQIGAEGYAVRDTAEGPVVTPL
jgi:cysteinyl-tRNA synthetase